MDKKYKDIDRIIELFIQGRLPRQLRDKVWEWLVRDDLHAEVKDRALQDIFNRIETHPDHHTYSALRRVRAKIAAHTQPADKPIRLARRRIVLRIAAVLVPLLFLAGFAWLYLGRERMPETPQVAQLHEVVIETPDGETRSQDLPDGSRVQVDPASNLVYHTDFAEDRTVTLRGEATFKVAKKDSLNPFTVETRHLKVTVLGTEFRVDAREQNGYTTVELFEGSLRVEARNTATLLEPGDRFTYHHAGETEAPTASEEPLAAEQAADAETAYFELANSDGFHFDGASLGEIFRRIEQIYGVQIQIEGELPLGGSRVVKFPTGETIDQVLRVLSAMTDGFTYEINQNIVTVKPKITE